MPTSQALLQSTTETALAMTPASIRLDPEKAHKHLFHPALAAVCH
jgi:hypothetical protein